MIKYSLCAVLLLGFIGIASAGTSSCVATPLSRKEAERLVLSVPDALVSKKMGGKLSAIEYKPPHSNDISKPARAEPSQTVTSEPTVTTSTTPNPICPPGTQSKNSRPKRANIARKLTMRAAPC